MVESSPRVREIVGAARALLDEEGPDAVSMRRVADRLGIRAPSIYKHLPDKGALESELISDGFEEMAARFTSAAARSRGDVVAALGRAYRGFARQHPHLYRLMTERPLDRARLRPGIEAAAAQPLVEALGGDPDIARAVFGFVHGMTVLELNGRFPPGADLDEAWRRGLHALTREAAPDG